MGSCLVTLSSIFKPASKKVNIFQDPYPQHLSFSISLPIIRYIIKNPSGPVWKKLIKTCKYFYSKSPLLPVGRISVDYFGSQYSADGKNFDPSLIFPKVWLYESFYTEQGSGLKINLISKIYKFDLRSLSLGRQNFSWNDYKKLTASGTLKELTFYRVFILNDDETIVPFNKVVENLHNLESLEFSGYKKSQILFTSDSAKKMLEHLTSFKNMKNLEIVVYLEVIDLMYFADFLLKNETIEVNFDLRFFVSEATKKTMENVIKEIRQNPRLKFPRIYCYNFDSLSV